MTQVAVIVSRELSLAASGSHVTHHPVRCTPTRECRGIVGTELKDFCKTLNGDVVPSKVVRRLALEEVCLPKSVRICRRCWIERNGVAQILNSRVQNVVDWFV